MNESGTYQRGDIVQSGPWAGFEVIDSYGDRQALEDGVLIDISGRLDPHGDRHIPNARATAGIFSRFAELARERGDVRPEEVESIARMSCQLIYRAVLRKPADADGWRKAEAREDGKSIGEVWLIPNEIGGLTLMLPEDY